METERNSVTTTNHILANAVPPKTVTVHKTTSTSGLNRLQHSTGSIVSYLDRVFAICSKLKTWKDIRMFTVLHICPAHMLKAVTQLIGRNTKDKGLKEFACVCNICICQVAKHYLNDHSTKNLPLTVHRTAWQTTPIMSRLI